MPARLDWDLDRGSGDVPEIHPEAPGPPPAAEAGFRVTVRILAMYAVALAAAGWVGFNLGRMSMGTPIERTVETQLAIEALAWERADADLFASTLDPDAPSAWRAGRMRQFQEYAPTDFNGEVSDREEIAAGLVRVLVAVTLPQGTYTESRTYRLAGNTWMRTVAPAASSTE